VNQVQLCGRGCGQPGAGDAGEVSLARTQANRLGWAEEMVRWWFRMAAGVAALRRRDWVTCGMDAGGVVGSGGLAVAKEGSEVLVRMRMRHAAAEDTLALVWRG
jgi:hypothetical protein